MNFPLNAFHDFGLDGALLIAVLIGIGFGFMLERGGFGSSKILSGIFYLKDWRVLKVMFSAIVTAMLGLYAAQGLGFVNMDMIALRQTFLGAQVVGGLLLGVGFVTAGYCPGTSMVGLVSGKFDAALVMLGILLGIGIFEEFFPAFESLWKSGYMERISLSEWMGINNGWVVLMVTAMAVGAFALVEWLERKPNRPTFPRELKRLALATGGVAVLVASAQFIGPGNARAMAQASAPTSAPQVTAIELASWAIEGRTDVMVLDLRGEDPATELPFAIPVSTDEIMDLRQRPDFPLNRLFVIVDDADFGPARDAAIAMRGSGFSAFSLRGGATRWNVDVLATESTFPIAATYQLFASGQSPFGGEFTPPPKPKKKLNMPKRKKKKGGGCS